MSCNNIPIFKGKVASDRNCSEIRQLILAEMTARATKNELRHLLRTSATQTRATTFRNQVTFTRQQDVIRCRVSMAMSSCFGHGLSNLARSHSSIDRGIRHSCNMQHAACNMQHASLSERNKCDTAVTERYSI